MIRTVLLAAALLIPAAAQAQMHYLERKPAGAAADLAITGLRLEAAEATVPTGFGFHFRIANLGDAAAEGARRDGVLRIVFYLTKDPRRPPSGPLSPLRRGEFQPGRPLGRSGIVGLPFRIPAGFRGRETARAVRLPAGIKPGRWWFCAMIDPDDVVRERNEANNIRCRPLRIVSAGGASAGRRQAEPARRPHRHGRDGKDGKKDTGREIARAILEDLLERKDRDGSPEALERPGGRHGRERPPAQARSEEPPPSPCALDGPLPNLRPAGVKTGSRLSRSRRNRAYAAVRNRGRGTAPAYDGDCGYRIHVVLSRSGEVTIPAAGGYGDDTHVVLDVAGGRALAPGERFAARPRDSVLDLSGVPRGRYWLCVVADPDNGVPESDETDNVRCEYRVSVD